MAQHMKHISVCIMIMAAMLAMAEATPPGIANNPSQSTCSNGKYKYCKNLVHVCPKFCPNSCTTDCVSCKPICIGGTTPGSDPDTPAPQTPDSDPKSPPYYPPPTITPPPSNSTPSTPPTTTPSSPSPPTPTPSPSNTSDPPASTPPSPSSEPPTTPSPRSSTPTPPSTTPTPSYPPSTSGKRRARCKDKKYEQCYNLEHECPSDCPGGCEVDCVSCKPVCKCDMPGAVCQDPRFIGEDGITFYFHGKKDQDFCLVSDSNIHINGHFIGKRSSNMTRDFTWVQSIGILFGSHRLFIGAQKTAIWNDAVDRLALAFDGEAIFLPEKQGATWQSGIAPSVVITRAGDVNNVIVEVEGNFKITAKVVPITEEDSRVHNYGITEDDSFAHLDLGFKFYSLSDRVSGVLGQTYGPDYVSKVKMGISMPVMGREKEFSSSTLFSADCSVSQFNGGALPLSSEMESCVSCVI